MKRLNLIIVLMLTALLLCTASVSAQGEDPVVLFTGNISPEGLESIFKTLLSVLLLPWGRSASNPAGSAISVCWTGAMMNFWKPWLKPGWLFPMPAPAASFIST